MIQLWKVNSYPVSISQESHICLSFVVRKCKMLINSGVFFIFSKFWYFRLLGVSKGKKRPKITKRLCLSCLISQEPYIIWFSFMVHMCKRIMSPGAFYMVNGKNDKNYVWLTLYLWNRTSYDCGFWLTCVKWWYLQQFFSFFQNSDFLGF